MGIAPSWSVTLGVTMGRVNFNPSSKWRGGEGLAPFKSWRAGVGLASSGVGS